MREQTVYWYALSISIIRDLHRLVKSFFRWAIDRRTQFTLQQFSHTKPKKHAIYADHVQILGAVNQIRTGDLFLTKEVLYQLSYNSISFIVPPPLLANQHILL